MPGFLKKIFFVTLLFSVLGGAFSCGKDATTEAPDMQRATRVAVEWNTLLLELERHTPGYRPPVSARMFAYVEMAAYEASLPALPDYLSLEVYTSGYHKPETQLQEGGFYLPASLNAAYARIARYFFPTAPKNLLESIDQLESGESQPLGRSVDPQVLNLSIAFGRSVADAVWRWSSTDSMGHDGFLYNFDRSYVPSECAGCWQPTGEHPIPALTPHWGGVRPFIVAPDAIQVKPPLRFDPSPGSGFYTEAMEVFTVSQPLSKENRWIAEFWSDDLPGLTLSPAGRWISIVNQSITKAKLPFPQAMETYLKSGLALCDASILCWKAKYMYNLERPQDYIGREIRPGWSPLHEAPNFPSYPSGHSMFGAAVAEVLTGALGNNFTLTDRTHEDRPEFSSAPRTYHSFSEMALENALSRVAMGVHYRMDCEEGLRLGKIIGRKSAGLNLKRAEAVKR